MSIRGAGTFLPFTIALLAPGQLKPRWAFLSGLSGLLVTLTWPLAGLPGDPLFAGLSISALCCVCGWTRKGMAQDEPSRLE